MISRITEVTVNPNKLTEVRRALDTQVIPTLKSQAGFIDAIDSLDANTGELVCVSLWRTREDADRFGQQIFPEMAEKLQPLALSQPTVRVMEVQTSTIHKIAASKAA